MRQQQHGGVSHPNLLTISEEDLQYCYTLATRVGKKWAQVLQRQGYVELAEITLTIVANGNFLEPQSPLTTEAIENNSNDRTGARSQRKSSSKCDFVSPYTALHALRRYPNDCNSSGLPLQQLTATNDDHDAKLMVPTSSTSARKVIQQIDTMVKRIGMSYWPYGWDAIEEAVKRNRQRIDYSRIGNTSTTTTIPFTTTAVTTKGNEDGAMEGGGNLINGMEGDNDYSCVGKSNQAAYGKRVIEHSRKRGRSAESSMANSTNNDDFFEEVNFDVNDSDINNNNVAAFRRGRHPSSIGAEVYHRNDILHELSVQKRKKLIESSIHPPFPYESDMVDVIDGNDDGELSLEEKSTSPLNHHAVICGALKEIGQVHLWEQTRHASRPIRRLHNGNESQMTSKEESIMTHSSQSSGMIGQINSGIIPGVSDLHSVFQSQLQQQLQKRASTRSVKERLGRRTISVAEYRAENAPYATCSKVRWTEEQKTNHRNDGTHKWLEMDIGECMIEVVDDGEQTASESAENTVNEKKEKFFLGFRSLEMAIKM